MTQQSFVYPQPSVYLSPPELVSLLAHPPDGVADHSDQQIDQQGGAHESESDVHHVDNGGRLQRVVDGQIDQPQTELKLGEEGDGKGAVHGEGAGVLGHVHHPQS